MRYSLPRIGFPLGAWGRIPILLCALAFGTTIPALHGATTPAPAHFDATSKLFDLDPLELDLAETLSVELWVRPDPQCPAGAVLLDKFGPGTSQGVRIETTVAGSLRLVTTAPTAIEASEPLPKDRPTHVIATFSPREQIAALYFDGKPVALLTPSKERLPLIGSQTPLRLGADQLGQHRFVGTIRSLALYNKALNAEEVERLTKGGATPVSLVGAWTLAADAGTTIPAMRGKGTFVVSPSISGHVPSADTNLLEMWYPRPAREWLESLPIGNGRLGGTVFGGVNHERIQLNENTIWSGRPYDPANSKAPQAIEKARALIFAGKQKEAEELIELSAMGIPKTMANYQTLGSVMLDFPEDPSPVDEYRRSLDLDLAVATTTFKRGGVTYKREVYASAPDQVVVIKLTADHAASLSFRTRWSTPFPDAKAQVDEGLLTLEGKGGAFFSMPGAVRFNAYVQVINEGGKKTALDQAIDVSGADSVVLIVSCGTNFINYHDLTGNPRERGLQALRAAALTDYETLKRRHIKDHQQLFRRVAFNLGSTEAATRPTDERIRKDDGSDTALAALYFQFGRYLLIASSRPGGQPANLQGLWNDALTAAWGGKYTVNINTEENYWPAETTNLSECAEPLFALIKDISVTGQHTAEVMYNAHGWVCHHNTDIWRATAPIDSAVGFWPTGGAWLTTHLWEHYLFTQDKTFLQTIYPILKGSAEFFVDILQEDPEHHWLVTCPSMSPEHGGLVAGPTMDMAILRDLFANTAKASELLGIDADFRQTILNKRERLAPYQIGHYGQLQEWLQDLDKNNDTHRHLSHLYGLFPGNQISESRDPKIFAAAKTSLTQRGMIGPGWSLAWKEALWARAGDGNKAHALLVKQLTPPKGGSQGGGSFPNLFDAHPPFQIDGNFAATAAIAEMLLQSQDNQIELLPALPQAWPTGMIAGLKARGGYEVDIAWKEGRLTQATIHSQSGEPVKVKYGARTETLTIAKGSSQEWVPGRK